MFKKVTLTSVNFLQVINIWIPQNTQTATSEYDKKKVCGKIHIHFDAVCNNCSSIKY